MSVGLQCPNCGHVDSMVVDSRPTSTGTAVRRRRRCQGCRETFATCEMAIAKGARTATPFQNVQAAAESLSRAHEDLNSALAIIRSEAWV